MPRYPIVFVELPKLDNPQQKSSVPTHGEWFEVGRCVLPGEDVWDDELDPAIDKLGTKIYVAEARILGWETHLDVWKPMPPSPERDTQIKLGKDNLKREKEEKNKLERERDELIDKKSKGYELSRIQRWEDGGNEWLIQRSRQTVSIEVEVKISEETQRNVEFQFGAKLGYETMTGSSVKLEPAITIAGIGVSGWKLGREKAEKNTQTIERQLRYNRSKKDSIELNGKYVMEKEMIAGEKGARWVDWVYMDRISCTRLTDNKLIAQGDFKVDQERWLYEVE